MRLLILILSFSLFFIGTSVAKVINNKQLACTMSLAQGANSMPLCYLHLTKNYLSIKFNNSNQSNQKERQKTGILMQCYVNGKLKTNNICLGGRCHFSCVAGPKNQLLYFKLKNLFAKTIKLEYSCPIINLL